MFTRFVVRLATLVLLVSIAGWSQVMSPLVAPVLAQEEVGEEIAPEPSPYTSHMKVLFEEMTLVRVLSEEYARIEAVCAGNGLNNVQPLPDESMVLIPNAGDLAVNGSNVAIHLNPDGLITFIPRVQGERIRVPMDVGDKVTGQEVWSLTFDEAMQLMAADKLVWTARYYGPYGNGHGLPGHIAECDPLYEGNIGWIIVASEPEIVVEDTHVVLEKVVEPLPYTLDMKVLFEEMTFVQVLSEEYARIEAVCAGNGLNNISPSPDGPKVLIPNAGDLSIDGANVAIRLNPSGEITFIPRVQGQRIRMPLDVVGKVEGEEVVSLTLNEAMRLLVAEKLYWTAKGHGLYGTGHGLPGHIAECDPQYFEP